MYKLIAFSLSLLLSSYAWSSETTFDKLVSEADAMSRFKQTTSNEHCPKYIIVEESRKQYLPTYAKEGDRAVRLWGYSFDGKSNEYFTHERNTILYRPGLATGESHILNMDINFIAGVGYNWSQQTDQNGVLTSEYSAKILSPYMIASGYSKVSYDSNKNTINYFFQGNGVDDVVCLFEKQ